VGEESPGSILYDALSGWVFIFKRRTAVATAIDTAADKVAGTVDIGGKPESAQTDGNWSRSKPVPSRHGGFVSRKVTLSLTIFSFIFNLTVFIPRNGRNNVHPSGIDGKRQPCASRPILHSGASSVPRK
jgi:hypothetical protein